MVMTLDLKNGCRQMEISMLENLWEIFAKLCMADVKINPKNNKFFKKEVKYLGHVILKRDQSMDKKKTEITASRPVCKGLIANSLITKSLYLLMKTRRNFHGIKIIKNHLEALKRFSHDFSVFMEQFLPSTETQTYMLRTSRLFPDLRFMSRICLQKATSSDSGSSIGEDLAYKHSRL
ncbi:hypothetical protein HZH68_002906 [Vespula germanica]|uniref:Reverse transcriptase domain-containing protein n=1 Tax=Vespula germanica TaxID=30212 RepID=A0A834U239_VESGE|nr:hypothetical protein HZH68_002906 [Vespula germanica]